MATQQLIRWICDDNPEHTIVTAGPTPDGWVQLVPSWGDGSGKNFDTMGCATTWYNSETPF